MGTLANSEDPDEMQHNTAFHQGLYCAKIKTIFRERNTNLENSTRNPFKYTMDSPILTVSICIGKIHQKTKSYGIGPDKDTFC